jgi:hypothetical protein
MLLYERVIPQMWIGAAHSIDLRTLAGRKFLAWVKTPASFEQSLPPQDFMDARNTSTKIVSGIEDGGVCIGDLLSER